MASASRKIARCLTGAIRRRILLGAFLLLLLAGAGAALLCGRFSSDLGDAFAENSEAGKAYRLLKESGIANRMIVELDFTPEKVRGAAVEQAARELARLSGVRSVNYRIDFGEAADTARRTVKEIPALFPVPVFGAEAADSAARNAFRQLSFPMADSAMLRADPFGFAAKSAEKLRGFHELSGLAFSFENEFFTSRDGCRALILLGVQPSGTEGSSSRLLVDAVRNIPQEEGVNMTLTAPHLHTIANEDVLRRDVTLLCTLGIAFFLLLTALVYRFDPASFLIPAIPLGASLLAAGGMALVYPRLYLAVLGMGAAVAGLAVDAGIHVYAACRGGCRVRSVTNLALPLLTGIGTTAGVFFLLCASGISIYAQLGVFAGCSLLITLGIAFFGLPMLPPKEHRTLLVRVGLPEFRRTGLIAGGFILLLLAAILSGRQLEMDSSIDVFDGSPEDVFRNEQLFRENWRFRPAPALLLLAAPGESELLERCSRYTGLLRERGVACFGVTDFFPSPSVAADNLASWREFGESGGLARLRREVEEAAVKRGLPVGFFTPFFDNVSQANSFSPEDSLLYRELVRRSGESFNTVIMLPDTEENILFLREAVREDGHSAVISPLSFSRMIAHDFAARFLWILPGALLFVIASVWFATRSPAGTLAALAPMAAAMLLIPAFFVLAGKPVNLMHCFAGVILLGITIDYGVFGLHAVREGKGTVPQAMTLAFLSTFFGVVILLFSKHPVLFDTGVVLSAGIFIAYLCGMFVTPALWRVLGGKKVKVWLLFLPVLLLSGCAGTPFHEPEYPELREKVALPSERDEPYVYRANAVFSYRFFTTPVLLVCRVEPAERSVLAAGFNPAGIKLFEGDRVFLPIGEEYRAMLTEAVRRDMGRILFDLLPPEGAERVMEKERLIFRFRSAEGEKMCYIYAGEPLRLIEKESSGWWFRNWRVRYYEDGVFYESEGYTVTLR